MNTIMIGFALIVAIAILNWAIDFICRVFNYFAEKLLNKVLSESTRASVGVVISAFSLIITLALFIQICHVIGKILVGLIK